MSCAWGGSEYVREGSKEGGKVTNHQSLVIRRPHRHTLQSIHNNLHHPRNRLPLLLPTLLESLDEIPRDLNRTSKLNDRPRAELVRVEVRHPDGNDLETEGRVGGDGAEGHDGDAGFEGEEVGAVVRTAFGEDSDATAVDELLVDRGVHRGLVDVREDLCGRR